MSDAEAESYQPGVSVSLVARRHDMNANLLFTWRRRYGKRAVGAGNGGLLPVVPSAHTQGRTDVGALVHVHDGLSLLRRGR